MSDTPLFEHSDDRERPDHRQEDGPDDPNSPTNDSNVGTVAGMTGPTPLTGAQIVDVTDDDPDTVT